MKRLRRFIILFLCLLMLIGTITGCSDETPNSEDTAEKKIKEEFKVGVVSSPAGFDPQRQSDNPSLLTTSMIYNSLIELNTDTMEYEPSLAESWDQVSDTEYVFHLRKGVKFHDGSEFSAQDVVYTFSRGAEMPTTRSKIINMENVEAIDDYTIKITLNEENLVFLFDISHKSMYILPNGAGDEISQNPVGTGPYKMIENLTDSHVKFERFEEYWDGPQPSKYITFFVYPESSSRVMALEAGEIDFCFDPIVSDFDTINDNENLELFQIPSVNIDFFAMNTSKPPFNDIHVRKAISYAINKKDIIDGAYDGHPKQVTSVLVPGAIGYKEDLETYEYDIIKAKEELSLSKYPNGFEFSLYTTQSRNTPCQLMQYQLSQLGIKMNIEFVNAVFDYARTGYSGAVWSSYQNPSLDGGYLNTIFSKNGVNNLMYYHNAEVDTLLNNIQFEINNDKRNDMIGEVQQIIAYDVPMVPLFSNVVSAGINKNVKGIILSPNTTHNFSTGYVEIE